MGVPQSPTGTQPRQTITVQALFTGAPCANQVCLTQTTASGPGCNLGADQVKPKSQGVGEGRAVIGDDGMDHWEWEESVGSSERAALRASVCRSGIKRKDGSCTSFMQCFQMNQRKLKIFVSSETISSATCFARGNIRCTQSQRPEGIWSYLFCSFNN